LVILLKTVKGKGNIKATVVADSISKAGQRITTFELEYHRYVHSEFMTHRQFSRNAASSRAIPVERVIEQVLNNPARPTHWGKNQSGMQAKEECTERVISIRSDTTVTREEAWGEAAGKAVSMAKHLNLAGYHKQIVNRILEPYQFIKVVVTATEYENFFYLRNHADAQPEIAELARVMLEAREQSEPELLAAGEWHLPYVKESIKGILDMGVGVDLEMQIKLSASLCAQVSYRKSDESLEKALKIYDQLVTMKPVHASPFEHQATPMACQEDKLSFSHMDAGITHVSVDGGYWSGNFKGWIQNRQLIKGHVYTGDE
jgi:thymidylate synthase ThyX